MLNRLSAELQQSLILPIELTINQVLTADPASQQKLCRHQGKVLGLRILSPLSSEPVAFYIRILDGNVSFCLSNEVVYDACLEGSINDFIALALSANKSNRLINSDIDLIGDSEFAIAVTGIIEQLDIDWEALISPLTGDLLAHQLGSGFRSLLRWGKSTLNTQRSAVKDYLETESALVVPAEQISTFANEVDELRLATDRLSARIEHLQKKQSSEKEA